MTIKKRQILILLVALVPAAGRAEGVAIGGTFGTLGLGGQATLRIEHGFNLRAAINWADFDLDIDSSDASYDLNLKFLSGLLLVDWHPFGSGLRFSGGLALNDSSVTVAAGFTGSQTIGGVTYPAAAIGTLIGDVSMDSVAPYIGIGYGNAVGPSTSWSFVFDLGVMFQTFDVELRSTGPLSDVEPFLANLKQEERDIQKELDKLRVYPVLTMGVAYQF